MASVVHGSTSADDGRHHKRTKSSVLKSFIHKRAPSNGASLPSIITTASHMSAPAVQQTNALAYMHNDCQYPRALAEVQQNGQSQQPPLSPKKSAEDRRPPTRDGTVKSLHKKTLSTMSLKSLANKDKEGKDGKPKKTKSSTNLANLLSRPKSSKSLKDLTIPDTTRTSKDKENQTPPSSTSEGTNARPPPIYAQFSSNAFALQPLGGKFLEDEVNMSTSEKYNADKQHELQSEERIVPAFGRQDEGSRRAATRPQLTYLPSNFSLQDIHRPSNESSRRSGETSRTSSGAQRPGLERKSTDKSDMTISKRSSRVMAAVAAFSIRQKDVEVEVSAGSPILRDEDVDKEFEAMLDRRNIPEHQRGKMRSLAKSMKKDFVKQDWAETAAAKDIRPGTNGSDSSADATTEVEDVPVIKSKRPRSMTFTLSNTLSRKASKDAMLATKKPRPVSTISKHVRNKSNDSTTSGAKTFTAASVAAATSLISKAKGQLPEDFVTYLKKVRQPELIEVGRLHKLRLLLRNETVAWTDDFIRQGGMEEIVGLLHRTMEVEWREEHEDLLLHEVLLCLKALSTTALALRHLHKIHDTLFPALLNMLFDEEKKGPSEFTTRNIITSLLFTYLKSSPLVERTERAKVVLSFLRNPEPKEEERPVGFVLEMHTPRPYTVWCKEVVNVTKEVFWIFLHNHNVIAQPTNKNTSIANELIDSSDEQDQDYKYMIDHFPQELPPVPAAPYVGGVEWDATNYLASHVELLNSILVSLPTKRERNDLRAELRISGWEKCMGGTLRLCKEKFYGGVHAGLRCWVAAAKEDGWDTKDVRCGPPIESRSPVRKAAASSPTKKQLEEPPKLALDFKFEDKKTEVDAWL